MSKDDRPWHEKPISGKWFLPDGSSYPTRGLADPNDYYEWADVTPMGSEQSHYIVVHEKPCLESLSSVIGETPDVMKDDIELSESHPKQYFYRQGLFAAIATIQSHINVYIGHANIPHCCEIVDALQAVIDEIKEDHTLT